jgi:OPA family glycerol-3-phosphate transporter-like MFS transporter
LLFALWLFNGYCQAGGWPPCVKVMANWFEPALRGRMMGIVGTSYQLGTSITLFGTGLLIVLFQNEWRVAFLIPAMVLLISTLHTAWRLQEQPPRTRAVLGDEHSSASAQRLPLARSFWVTLTNGHIWVLAIGLLGLDVVRFGFLDWVPTHLKEVQGIRIDAAGLKAAVLPLGGAFGALMSGWVSDRFFSARRAPVIVISLLMVGLLTIAYEHVVSLSGAGTVVCLGLIGFFLYAAQIMLVGTAAQDFARLRTSAAAAGFVDFMGYTGAFGGDVVTGYLLKHRDWHTAIYFWAGTAFCAALVVSTLWYARADNDS